MEQHCSLLIFRVGWLENCANAIQSFNRVVKKFQTISNQILLQTYDSSTTNVSRPEYFESSFSRMIFNNFV